VTDDGPPQLQLGGGEVPTEQAQRSSSAGRGAALSYAQRAILRKIEDQGSIRPVEAGVIVHAHRGTGCCGFGAAADRYKGGGKACCGYASSDGSAALKRLRERGLVQQRQDRSWEAA
jgi:hypothetical protein